MIVAIYPIVLRFPYNLIFPFLIAGSYLTLLRFPLGQLPTVVVWVRSFLLLYIGLLTQRLRALLNEYGMERNALIQQASDGIFITDLDGNFIEINEYGCQMLGCTRKEILQKNIQDVIVFEIDSSPLLFTELREGKTIHIERLMRHKNGMHIPVEISAKMINDGRLQGIVRDITERKQAENAMNESRSQLASIIESAMDGIITTDANQTIVLFNAAAEKMFRISAPEAIGQPIDRFIPSRFREVHREHIRRFGETGITSRLMHQDVLSGLRADGEEFPIEASISQADINGQKFYTVVHRDVTERMLAEQKLRDATQFLEAIVASSPVGIISYDVDGYVLTWNPAAERVFGWKSEEVIGQIAPHIGHEHLHEFHTLRQRVIQGESLDHVELIRQKKDGTPIVINLNTAPRFDELGDLTGYTAIIADITERKQAEEKMQKQNQRLKALRDIDTAILAADSVEDIVGAALDHIRQLISCERANLALIEWEKNEAVNFDVRDSKESAISIGARISLNLIRDVLHVLSKGQPVVIDDFTTLPDPPPQIKIFIKEGLRSRCILPLFSQGNLIGSFTLSSKNPAYFDEEKINLGREVANQVAIAITQSRLVDELEERLRERETLIADLTTKNAELESFTYTVSHDLKSPLVTIKGFLGYLEQDAINGNVERLKGDARRISNAVEKMQGLLSDLLELSRIGRFVNPSEAIPFEELVQEAVELVEGHIQERGVTVELRPNLPVVYGDRRRLTEVLENLLDNAVKYMGNQQEPHIEIGRRGEEADMHVFYVKDNGLGIAPEYHEKVFGLFNKLDTTSEGTGIGLALVRRIIEYHGGSIWIKSEPGKGSIFYFTIPIVPSI